MFETTCVKTRAICVKKNYITSEICEKNIKDQILSPIKSLCLNISQYNTILKLLRYTSNDVENKSLLPDEADFLFIIL